MVTVQLRFLGEACWRAMTLPVSSQAAQTLASAAKVLRLGDQVQISPCLLLKGAVDKRV
jgi:hypothetical protein